MSVFAQKLRERDAAQNIFLVTGGKDYSGLPAWYYVQVAPQKKPHFQHAIKTGKAKLDQFGTILTSGYGKTPHLMCKSA